KINRRIERQIETNINYYAEHPHEIDQRLRELDQEWDIERTLEANASTLALGGTLLGAFVDRRLLVLPALVTAFLLQHALQGWCPPIPIFRRRGVRTAEEIARERYALKALRGDFSSAQTPAPSRAVASGWPAYSECIPSLVHLPGYWRLADQWPCSGSHCARYRALQSQRSRRCSPAERPGEFMIQALLGSWPLWIAIAAF